MKQLEIKTNKRLLIVEAISKGVADAWVFNSYGLKTMMNSVCIGSEFTEEKARLYIEPVNRIYSPKGWDIWFKDFAENTKYKTSALESFISAIESNGWYWGENPMKSPDEIVSFPQSGVVYDKSFKRFNESESRTFNPEKCLIFEIL